MNTSLSYSPMRVACRGHRKSAGYLIRIGARAGDRRSLDSLHGPAVPMNDNLPAPTIESGVNSSRVGSWRRTIELANSLSALVRRLFLPIGRRDMCRSGFLNSLGGIKAPRSLGFSLRVALVNDANQPANRIARTFSFTPVQVLSSAVLHARNMQQKDARSHEQCTREYE